ncbi:MAG: hypothetical protein H8E85_03615 [Candidatus Marinimicrobia bacterium]|nr:hypothetical protein [Candidatus Neomarinimicrobiota bacterium]
MKAFINFYIKKITELNITDATCSQQIEKGSTVGAKDMIEAYSFKKNSILTACCGENINKDFDYPRHLKFQQLRDFYIMFPNITTTKIFR